MNKHVYSKEAEKRWGNTDAYKESISKTTKYSKSDWETINEKAYFINNKLAHCMDKPIDDEEVQKLVQDWQNHITKYYYNCTPDILRGLGEMYISEVRFKKNYDDIRPGLAQFFSDAIKRYCAIDNNVA